MSAAIKRFIVDGGVPTMLGKGVAIRWAMDPLWAQRTTKVKILWGRSATDEFEVVGEVQDESEFLDSQRRATTASADSWYALKVEDLDNGEYWFSNPQPVGTALRKREWLAAREIIRRETFRLVKLRGGSRGWLLRRRIAGKTCTYCTSPETGQVTRPDCTYCYGTSFLGGYYPPQEMWVEMNPDTVLRRLDPEQGAIADFQKSFRCLAYPLPNPNDYWVSAKTGLAYRFKENLATEARIEEEPLTLRADVYVEQSDNVIYKFPIPAT
jgi:hypothetical protein